jgi:4'-phosphopantetheinyl transferase EntD
MKEFEIGRGHAKRALAMLGVHDIDVVVGKDRAPVWPTGVVGSLAHVTDNQWDSYCAAAVAPAEILIALGIDIEREDRLHPHTWAYFLTGREVQRVLCFSADSRRAEAHYLWCAKEAATKAVGRPLDPRAIEIEHDHRNGEYLAILPRGAGGTLQVRGRTARSAGFYLATAMVGRQ